MNTDPAKIHEAMMNAPHDGQPYRQARAAIKAVAAGNWYELSVAVLGGATFISLLCAVLGMFK